MRRSLVFIAALALLAAFFAAASEVAAQTAVSWDTLGKVRVVQQNGRRAPAFDPEVRRLAGQQVTVQGFMLPLEQGARQRNFLLTVVPMADCFYCLQHGPGSMLEVRAAQPAAYTYARVAVTGRLELVTDDPLGMYYRLVNARVTG
jgi:hypothetical protein